LNNIAPQILGLYIGQLFTYKFNGTVYTRPLEAMDIVCMEDFENPTLFLRSIMSIDLEDVQMLFDISSIHETKESGEEHFPPNILDVRFPEDGEVVYQAMDSFGRKHCYCTIEYANGDTQKDMPIPLSMFYPEQVVYLAQQGYDLFDIIESGSAVELE
jgi:hypothetical protein